MHTDAPSTRPITPPLPTSATAPSTSLVAAAAQTAAAASSTLTRLTRTLSDPGSPSKPLNPGAVASLGTSKSAKTFDIFSPKKANPATIKSQIAALNSHSTEAALRASAQKPVPMSPYSTLVKGLRSNSPDAYTTSSSSAAVSLNFSASPAPALSPSISSEGAAKGSNSPSPSVSSASTSSNVSPNASISSLPLSNSRGSPNALLTELNAAFANRPAYPGFSASPPLSTPSPTAAAEPEGELAMAITVTDPAKIQHAMPEALPSPEHAVALPPAVVAADADYADDTSSNGSAEDVAGQTELDHADGRSGSSIHANLDASPRISDDTGSKQASAAGSTDSLSRSDSSSKAAASDHVDSTTDSSSDDSVKTATSSWKATKVITGILFGISGAVSLVALGVFLFPIVISVPVWGLAAAFSATVITAVALTVASYKHRHPA